MSGVLETRTLTEKVPRDGIVVMKDSRRRRGLKLGAITLATVSAFGLDRFGRGARPGGAPANHRASDGHPGVYFKLKYPAG